jgi:predicted tellurium resistance membrane protein TerC
MEWISNPEAWIALLTLTALELVLGIDNIVFISILAAKVEPRLRARARTVGLALAMLTRIVLLFSLSWVIRLTSPLFTLLANQISGRDLILIIGGLFLLGKATHEIHDKLEGQEQESQSGGHASFGAVIAQIAVLDMIFSLDSVITAVGMVDEIQIMVLAVMISIGIMMISAKSISDFVEEHPTVKILALSFLLLIGTALIADGLEFHIPRGYIYFAMSFSVLVELLNLRMRASTKPPIKLRSRIYLWDSYEDD